MLCGNRGLELVKFGGKALILSRKVGLSLINAILDQIELTIIDYSQILNPSLKRANLHRKIHHGGYSTLGGSSGPMNSIAKGGRISIESLLNRNDPFRLR